MVCVGLGQYFWTYKTSTKVTLGYRMWGVQGPWTKPYLWLCLRFLSVHCKHLPLAKAWKSFFARMKMNTTSCRGLNESFGKIKRKSSTYLYLRRHLVYFCFPEMRADRYREVAVFLFKFLYTFFPPSSFSFFFLFLLFVLRFNFPRRTREILIIQLFTSICFLIPCFSTAGWHERNTNRVQNE